MASTYPLEIIQAQQWLGKNAKLKGEELDKGVQSQNWDPSVQATAMIPDLLKRLAEDITWTTNLGNAFLAQQADVMAAVQRLRKKAKDAGKLESNDKMKVETKVVETEQVVVIEPTSTQVVYVPAYNPTVIWGPPVYYPYPPVYYPPPPPPGAMLFSFGVGMMMGAAMHGGYCCGCGWGHSSTVVINNNNNFVNHYNRTNNVATGGGQSNWQHNGQHRGGAPYGDRATATKYGGGTRGGGAPGGAGASTMDRGGPGASGMDRGGASAANRGGPGASGMDRGGAGPSSMDRGGGGAQRGTGPFRPLRVEAPSVGRAEAPTGPRPAARGAPRAWVRARAAGRAAVAAGRAAVAGAGSEGDAHENTQGGARLRRARDGRSFVRGLPGGTEDLLHAPGGRGGARRRGGRPGRGGAARDLRRGRQGVDRVRRRGPRPERSGQLRRAGSREAGRRRGPEGPAQGGGRRRQRGVALPGPPRREGSGSGASPRGRGSRRC